MITLVSFGELVWDVIEGLNGSVRTLGGSACASAVHAKNLGAQARLVSAVGGDEPGRAALDELSRRGVNPEWILTHSVAKTACVRVSLEPEGLRYSALSRFPWGRRRLRSNADARSKRRRRLDVRPVPAGFAGTFDADRVRAAREWQAKARRL
ncbi:MAG: PfkB family carbohydrate kinase [Myxococcota bacterium]